MTFGAQVDETAALRIVDRAIEGGVNFFDTANIYNHGVSETIVGKALKGRRDRVVLASKVRGKMGDGADEVGLSRAAMHKAIDASLRRLGTDYLDLYYLHQPDYDVRIEETLAAMDELVRAGKVRYPAASNYAAWQMTQVFATSEKQGYRAPFVTQPMYNLLARGLEPEYVPMCREFGVSMVVYNPLAGGLLTGKQKREAPIAGTRFDNNQMYLSRYWYDATFDAVQQLAVIARDAGRSMVSLSLNWLLHHTATDCVILGASRLEHLEENLAAIGQGPLSAETVAACDGVWAALRGVTPQYNR